MITNLILIFINIKQNYSPMKKQSNSINQNTWGIMSCRCATQEHHTTNINSL